MHHASSLKVWSGLNVRPTITLRKRMGSQPLTDHAAPGDQAIERLDPEASSPRGSNLLQKVDRDDPARAY